jgi:hypothetical protein
MELTEIKKILYKQNPKAKLQMIRKNVAYYETFISTGFISSGSYKVSFEIPVNDMGDADFMYEMDSKYLNRWIVNNYLK